MVPRDRIDDAEAALLAGGWKGTKLDPYDQRYYRRWSHEIPPLSYPGRLLGVDVHHTICPPRSRLRPDPARFWADAEPAGDTGVRVLSAVDSVLHSAVHLFFDSDFDGSLPRLGRPARIVGGVRQARGILAGADRACAGATAWDARFHYAFATLSTVLRTPIPAETLRDARAFKPNPVDGRLDAQGARGGADADRSCALAAGDRGRLWLLYALALAAHARVRAGAASVAKNRSSRRPRMPPVPETRGEKARVSAGLFAAKCRIPATRSVGA